MSQETTPAGGTTSARQYHLASEPQLVQWARERDQRAFTILIEPLQSMLYRVCYRITHHEQDAQDALQTALTAAWRHLSSFQGRSRFSTWLHQIASNAALEQVKRRDTHPVGDRVEEVESTGRTPEQAVTDVEAVRWALQKIPPSFRAAIVLREYAGLSYREIADAEGIKVETVKTRIARARQALTELLINNR